MFLIYPIILSTSGWLQAGLPSKTSPAPALRHLELTACKLSFLVPPKPAAYDYGLLLCIVAHSSGLLLRNLIFSYHYPETILFTVYPYDGHLN